MKWIGSGYFETMDVVTISEIRKEERIGNWLFAGCGIQSRGFAENRSNGTEGTSLSSGRTTRPQKEGGK